MSGLGIEAEAFLRAFFTGMLLCGIYEALRIFRRLIRHHPLFVSVEDFISVANIIKFIEDSGSLCKHSNYYI